MRVATMNSYITSSSHTNCSSWTHQFHYLPFPSFNMFSVASLVTLVTLAVAVTAEPIMVRESPVKLSFAKHFNFTGAGNLLKKDQARAAFLKEFGNNKALGKRAVISSPVTNGEVSYLANVGVGSVSS